MEKRRPELASELKRGIAEAVGTGAIRYNIIRVQAEKQIVFKWEEALSFEGNNAPYLQYTHARGCSILRKSKTKGSGKFDASRLKDPHEIAVIRLVSEFPDVVEKSARDMRPHYIATYAYGLCDSFNQFYQSVPVLKADERARPARLALVRAARITLGNALRLLGIEAPDRM